VWAADSWDSADYCKKCTPLLTSAESPISTGCAARDGHSNQQTTRGGIYACWPFSATGRNTPDKPWISNRFALFHWRSQICNSVHPNSPYSPHLVANHKRQTYGNGGQGHLSPTTSLLIHDTYESAQVGQATEIGGRVRKSFHDRVRASVKKSGNCLLLSYSKKFVPEGCSRNARPAETNSLKPCSCGRVLCFCLCCLCEAKVGLGSTS